MEHKDCHLAPLMRFIRFLQLPPGAARSKGNPMGLDRRELCSGTDLCQEESCVVKKICVVKKRAV